jgi:hypothetical protein
MYNMETLAAFQWSKTLVFQKKANRPKASVADNTMIFLLSANPHIASFSTSLSDILLLPSRCAACAELRIEPAKLD